LLYCYFLNCSLISYFGFIELMGVVEDLVDVLEPVQVEFGVVGGLRDLMGFGV
jgi:hypothetical protein